MSAAQLGEPASDSPASHESVSGAPASNAPASQEPRGYSQEKDKYLARLRRIEGQVRGVHRMVAQDVYCIDVLTQISALTSALENVALGLLDDHLRHCVVHAAQAGGDEAETKLAEASAAITRLVKS